MGASVERGSSSTTVEATPPLHGIEADMSQISDTAQTLAVVAAVADGPTRVTGIAFIRGKETDRVGPVVTELRRAGIDASAEAEGFVIQPGRPPPPLLAAYADPRIAMSLALTGLTPHALTLPVTGCVAQ